MSRAVTPDLHRQRRVQLGVCKTNVCGGMRPLVSTIRRGRHDITKTQRWENNVFEEDRLFLLVSKEHGKTIANIWIATSSTFPFRFLQPLSFHHKPALIADETGSLP